MGDSHHADGSRLSEELSSENLITNRQTITDFDRGLWERPAMSAPIAFLRYQTELKTARLALPGNRLFIALVDSGGEDNRIMTLAPGESCIIGRHKLCDLTMRHSNAALRQIAVHYAASSTEDAPLLRIWDLHTGHSLSTEDEANVEALASNGPTFLSIGRYHLAAIPLGQLPQQFPVSSREAWAALPERQFISAVAEGTGSRLMPHKKGGYDGTSSITRMPGSITLEELELEPLPHGCEVGTLIIQGQRKRREFRLGHEHLERGVLVGRYSRCLGRGLDLTVSRVHLLLTSVGGDTVAIDTASKTGSRLNGQRFSSMVLKSETKIGLGKHSYLVWSPSRAHLARC